MSEYENLCPQSLSLKPVNGSSLSSNCKQRRSFADRLFSKGMTETKKNQKGNQVSERSTQSPKFIRQQSFPGILRQQNKPTKSKSKSFGQNDSKTAEKNLPAKPVPTRKVAFNEHIESALCRPTPQRGFGIEMEQWESDDDDDDDECFFPRNEDVQKISNSKDYYFDAPRSLVLDNSGYTCPEEEETYLPSFDLYKEALTQPLFSSDEDSEIEEDRCDHLVCHHPECVQSAATGKCLLLCKECDTNIHRQPGFSGHLVLDLPPSVRSEFVKKAQAKTEIENASDMEEPVPDYDIEEEILEEDHVDGLGVGMNNSSIRSSGIEKRLRRKDAVKRKTSYGSAKI